MAWRDADLAFRVRKDFVYVVCVCHLLALLVVREIDVVIWRTARAYT